MLRTLSLASLIAFAAPLGASELQVGQHDATTESSGLAAEIVATAFASGDAKAQAMADFEKQFVAGFKSNENARLLAEQRPDVLTAALAAGKVEFSQQYDRVAAPAMMKAIAEVYATKLTAAELRDALAYYRTPQAQRLIASFGAPESKRGAEVAAAAADPVVAGYQASSAGVKEQSISGDVTDAMMKSIFESLASIMPTVNKAVRTAVEAKLSKATP